MAAPTARLLEAPIAGTVAALRAHRTRWAQKLDHAAGDRAKKTIENKIAEYDRRIAAILGHTTPALPAPERDPDAEEEQGPAGEHFDERAPDQPVTKVGTEPPAAIWAEAAAAQVAPKSTGRGGNEELSRRRAKLKGAVRQDALRKFRVDINAALSRDHDGLTLSRLADGVPVEEWFVVGLLPEEAAERCLYWRMIKTEPPTEEIAADEAEQPVKTLLSK